MSLSFDGRSENREQKIKAYYDSYNALKHHENKCREALIDVQFPTIPNFSGVFESLQTRIGIKTIEILDAKEELSKRMNSEFCA